MPSVTVSAFPATGTVSVVNTWTGAIGVNFPIPANTYTSGTWNISWTIANLYPFPFFSPLPAPYLSQSLPGSSSFLQGGQSETNGTFVRSYTIGPALLAAINSGETNYQYNSELPLSFDPKTWQDTYNYMNFVLNYTSTAGMAVIGGPEGTGPGGSNPNGNYPYVEHSVHNDHEYHFLSVVYIGGYDGTGVDLTPYLGNVDIRYASAKSRDDNLAVIVGRTLHLYNNGTELTPGAACLGADIMVMGV